MSLGVKNPPQEFKGGGVLCIRIFGKIDLDVDTIYLLSIELIVCPNLSKGITKFIGKFSDFKNSSSGKQNETVCLPIDNVTWKMNMS